jgi:hypothetical protein
MRTSGIAAIFLAAWAGAAGAATVRIYKQVDDNGHVTYGNVLPRDAAFTTLEVDTDTVLPEPTAPEALRPDRRLERHVRAARATPPRAAKSIPASARKAPSLALRLDFRLAAPLPISMR